MTDLSALPSGRAAGSANHGDRNNQKAQNNMKTGITLQELATTVTERRSRIRDYEANTSAMQMDETGGVITLTGANLGETRIKPNTLFHGQLAEKVGIPARYYDRMLQSTEASDQRLLQSNVNHWLHSQPATRLVRTYTDPVNPILPNVGRAFLSDRYRPLDNFDMMNALLPPLMETGMQVASSQVTDERLYLQCITPRVAGEIKVGEPVNMGLVVTNSETGMGALSIQVLIYVLRCTNGMVLPTDDGAFRKAHLGGRVFSDSEQYLTSETKQLRDRALWAEARDVIKAAVTESSLARYIDVIRGTTQVPLRDPVKAVELTVKRYGLIEEEKTSIMSHLVAGGDATQWGLIQAVTRTAQDVPSYDRAFQLESIGGKMLALKASDFGGSN